MKDRITYQQTESNSHKFVPKVCKDVIDEGKIYVLKLSQLLQFIKTFRVDAKLGAEKPQHFTAHNMGALKIDQ